MKPQAAIITLHRVANYGSCLQAYATQRLFHAYGWESQIIDYYRPSEYPETQVERYFQGRKLSKFKTIWEKYPLAKSALQTPLKQLAAVEKRPFLSFCERYLQITDQEYRTYEELCAAIPSADLYCTGSDQVWNSVWNNGFDPAYTLGFAPAGKPKISLAASIGRENLDDWEKPLFAQALSAYQSISVREECSQALLEDLGIKGSIQVPDPTLMLNFQQWRALITYPPLARKNYILVYKLNRDNRILDYAQALSKRLGLPVLKLALGVHDLDLRFRNVYLPAVTDLLGLFARARFILSDSFHATSFALNFERPFAVVLPGRFQSRITDILGRLDLSDRILTPGSSLKGILTPIEYPTVRQKLEKDRQRGHAFLKQALEPAKTQAKTEPPLSKQDD